MTNESNEEKKIFVDENWKDQVEAERQEAQQKPVEPEAAADAEADINWPDPDLSMLVSTLATQATISLGLMAHPADNQIHQDLGQAKHLVDMLVMLKTKTEGNRTDEESTMVEEVLHELQMAFVTISSAPAE
jgi:Domain of unknown function (DUF1844)